MTDLYKDLVERDGVYYRKLSDVPFSGKVTGLYKGNFKNGKEDGEWVINHENGEFWWKGNYKNGEQEGVWVGYHENGQLVSKGNYKNGKKEDEWVSYWDDGQLMSKVTGRKVRKKASSLVTGLMVSYISKRAIRME